MNHSLLISTGAIVGIAVAIVVVLLIILFVGAYNSFVRLKNVVEEGWETIDVYLKQRYDLIANLVETVKGFAKHESETLQKVIASRNIAMQASTGEAKIAAEKELTNNLKTLFNVVAESYPQLQANTNFLDLQNQLKQIENELASARKYYNGTVKTLNTKIEMFPSNLVASMMKLKKYPYFELDSEEERKNVKVSF